jgi:hypothetical protein
MMALESRLLKLMKLAVKPKINYLCREFAFDTLFGGSGASESLNFIINLSEGKAALSRQSRVLAANSDKGITRRSLILLILQVVRAQNGSKKHPFQDEYLRSRVAICAGALVPV